MSKPFDMELFLSGVLTGPYAPGNVMCDRRKSSRLRLQTAGSEKRLGLGKKSMWLGFSRTA